jgi:uncharacterized protein (TIGR04255 family)
MSEIPAEMITPRRIYERPPVFQRIATVVAEVDQELHEARFEEWRLHVETEFPHYEPLEEWLINVTEKEGIPLWDTMQPELKITPRFSKKPKKENFDWSLRCPPGKLSVNMHSNPENPRRYHELQHSFSTWLPRWIERFEVKKLTRVSLRYINRLNQLTIPNFTVPPSQLLLDQVLNVFVKIPGEHDSLIPPYDCRATLLLGGMKGATFEIRVYSDPDASIQPSVRVDFCVNVPVSPEDSSEQGILRLLNWCHERILDRFELVFTEAARQSFGPSTQ